MAKITRDGVKDCLRGSALTLATLAGVIGGVVFGLALRGSKGEGGETQRSYFFKRFGISR